MKKQAPNTDSIKSLTDSGVYNPQHYPDTQSDYAVGVNDLPLFKFLSQVLIVYFHPI